VITVLPEDGDRIQSPKRVLNKKTGRWMSRNIIIFVLFNVIGLDQIHFAFNLVWPGLKKKGRFFYVLTIL
jgi:hypothetical protein